MKTSYIFVTAIALSLAGTGTATAKNSHAAPGKHATPADQHRQNVRQILQKQQDALAASREPAARTTSPAQERLIAMSGYNYSFADTPFIPVGKTDSTFLKYTGTRGSKYNKDIMGFIPPSGQYYMGGSPTQLIGGGMVHTSTSASFPNDVLADSTWTWNPFVMDTSGNYHYGLYDVVSNAYDANNNVTLCNDKYNIGDTTTGWERFINTYDASNNVISSVSLSYNMSSWDTFLRTQYAYNTSGQLVADSTDDWSGPGVWYPNSKQYYTYNTAGNLVYSNVWQDSSSVWVEAERYVIGYNADNTIKTDSNSSVMFGIWSPTFTDSFGYTAGVNYWTYLQMYFYEGTDFEKDVYIKHVNAAGLPDTLTGMQYTSMATAPSYLASQAKGAYIYDTYNNPSIAYNYAFNIADPGAGTGSYETTPTNINHYYYETFGPDAVKDVVTKESINVFPNPATSEIKISRPDAVKGAYTFVRFTNAIGQTVRTESMPWMNDTESFSVADLAPGMYIISLQDKAGNVLTTQKIVKN